MIMNKITGASCCDLTFMPCQFSLRLRPIKRQNPALISIKNKCFSVIVLGIYQYNEVVNTLERFSRKVNADGRRGPASVPVSI